YVSTGIIILSSITMFLAQRSAKNDQLSEVKIWLIVTLSLGLAFVFSQFLGYNQLVNNGIFFSGGNISGSFFYAITGLHAAHVIGGVLALIITSGKSILEKYNSKNYLGIQLCATYWHFMGFVWLSLLVFICIFGGYQ
ncbi:MAG: cytochrome c oxidase subunit 3, partial [Bacteroidota bacterium]